MEFKDRIKMLRETFNLTPSQLGAAMNKSEGAIRSWETGKAKPDAETIIKLAAYFKCSTDYLLGISSVKSLSKIDSLETEMANLDDEINKLYFSIAKLREEMKKIEIQLNLKQSEEYQANKQLKLLLSKREEVSKKLEFIKKNLE